MQAEEFSEGTEDDTEENAERESEDTSESEPSEATEIDDATSDKRNNNKPLHRAAATPATKRGALMQKQSKTESKETLNQRRVEARRAQLYMRRMK